VRRQAAAQIEANDHVLDYRDAIGGASNANRNGMSVELREA